MGMKKQRGEMASFRGSKGDGEGEVEVCVWKKGERGNEVEGGEGSWLFMMKKRGNGGNDKQQRNDRTRQQKNHKVER